MRFEFSQHQPTARTGVIRLHIWRAHGTPTLEMFVCFTCLVVVYSAEGSLNSSERALPIRPHTCVRASMRCGAVL
jgi:hypothetical protein